MMITFHSSDLYARRLNKDGWREHKSTHFIVYYRDAPIDFVQTVEDNAEQYYREITSNLGFTRYKGWTFDKRAKIYIYDNRDDYVNSRKAFGWSHGATSARRREIWTFPQAHGFFDSILPHELGHIIFREFVGFKSNIPLWLDEGVAMFQEKAKRWGANSSVISSIKQGRFFTVEGLTNIRLAADTPQAAIDLFYAESASLVYFMINELGRNRFVRFCRELEKGQRFEFALSKVYVRFKSLGDLNKAWVKYLQDQDG